MMQKLALRLPWRRPATPSLALARTKAGGVSAADVDGFPMLTGAGGGWNRSEYGDYYATSTPVYSAIRVRADALTRPPVVVYRRAGSDSGAQRLPVGPEHPAQRLLERVNRWYTSARPVEGHRDLPEPLGLGLLDAGPGRRRESRAVAPAARPHVHRTRSRRVHPRLRLPRAQPHDGPDPRRGGVVPLLQPLGGVRRPFPRGSGPDGRGHGTGRPAVQPQLPAQLGAARLRDADQRVHERQRGRRILPPLGGPLPGPGQRSPSGRGELRPRHQDSGPEPPGDGLHPGSAVEPGGGQPGPSAYPARCCRTSSAPRSPTSTPPSAFSGATPWSPR